MSRITLQEYLNHIQDFAKNNPEYLDLPMVTSTHLGVHGIHTDKPIVAVIEGNGHRFGSCEFFCEDEPQENFKLNVNAICVGLV